MTNCCWWEIQNSALSLQQIFYVVVLLFFTFKISCCAVKYLWKNLFWCWKNWTFFIYYFTWVGCLNISFPLFNIFWDQTVLFHCSPKTKVSLRLLTKPSLYDRNFLQNSMSNLKQCTFDIEQYMHVLNIYLILHSVA